MLKGIVIAFFCFILFLLIHAVIFHNWKVKKRFQAIIIIFYSLFLVYTLIYFLTPSFLTYADSSVIAGFVNGVVIYVFLFFGYCQFYFIIDRSISVRVMIELENSPEKQLTAEEIKKVYSLDSLLTRRLGQMVGTNYIVESSGFYKNTRKGRYEARFFKFLKDFMQLGPGG